MIQGEAREREAPFPVAPVKSYCQRFKFPLHGRLCIAVNVVYWLLLNMLSCNFCLKDLSQWSFARIDLCTLPKGFFANIA